MFYTGIGARKTPDDILYLIGNIASNMGESGFTLRSGGANGADSAFEKGCCVVNGKKEIYLPWKGFNGNKSDLYEIPDAAFIQAEIFYMPSRWKHCKQSVKKLMARNMQQVRGKNLDVKTDFVICWTPDGCETLTDRKRTTGGTGQAIAYADALNIPVFNLANEGTIKRITKHIELMGVFKW